MQQSDFHLSHMEDLAARAVRTGLAASRFLTPAEAQSVTMRFTRRNDVSLCLDGGYEGAERVRAVFLNPDWGAYDRAELFTALKLTCRDPLEHRDILGSLMALGIERDTIGDIHESASTLIALPELSRYIIETLTKVGRAGVRVSEISLDELSARSETLTVSTDTVASLRLDAVLCAAYGLSRSAAAELVTAGRVSLDHVLCLQPAKELTEGSLLSVRGLGRAKLLEVGGMSRKKRIFIKIGLY